MSWVYGMQYHIIYIYFMFLKPFLYYSCSVAGHLILLKDTSAMKRYTWFPMRYVFSQPLCYGQNVTRSIFKWSTTDLNFPSARLVALLKLKSSVCPTIYTWWGGGRTDGFMSFPRALAKNEMQTASFRIWIQITNSIFNDDCSTKHAS